MSEKEYHSIILVSIISEIYSTFLDKPIDNKLTEAIGNAFVKIADPSLIRQLVLTYSGTQHKPFSETSTPNIQNERYSALSVLIREASRLASDGETDGNRRPHNIKGQPLMSVLERLNQESDDQLKLCIEPAPLASGESLNMIFPTLLEKYDGSEREKHLEKFQADFSTFFFGIGSKFTTSTPDFNTVLSHLISLAYRYTWCLPVEVDNEIKDVSLFDYIKIKASIVACLYRYHEYHNTFNKQNIEDDSEKFCLALGDLSGIQKYIFDIAKIGAGGGIARRLRARSLFVQLITEVAAHKILHRIQIPLTNIIMSSGGKFYLLLPNTPETQNIIHETRTEIDRWLLNNLNGELSINLEMKNLKGSSFSAGLEEGTGFGSVLRDLNTDLTKRKRLRLADILIKDEEWIEDNFKLNQFEYDDLKICKSCNRLPRSFEELCAKCHKDMEIGKILPDSKYIAFFKTDDGENEGFQVLGYRVAVKPNLNFLTTPYLVYKLNNATVDEISDYPILPKFVTNYVPKAVVFNCDECQINSTCTEKPDHPNEPAKFNCLANCVKWHPLLGFLKADVDNLGANFIYGLKRNCPAENQDSITRLTTLSRQMDIFFSGWVEQLLRTDEFKHCYNVFSGGDDLFVVGPWKETINLAKRIRKDFETYSGNDNLTLSAGIFLSRSHYPVSRAADEVEALLKGAKNNERNSVSILNKQTFMHWDEWEFVEKQWLELQSYMNMKKVSSRFLFSLLQYGRMWKDYDNGNGNILGLRFQPLLAYNLARNFKKEEQNSKIYQWAERLIRLNDQDTEQKLILNNLELTAELLMLSKERES